MAELMKIASFLGVPVRVPVDQRTAAEKAAEQEARRQKRAHAQVAIRLSHEAVLAAAEPFRRAVLELHAPVFWNEHDDRGRCEGCDAEGCDWENPAFPCRTYDLAANFSAVGDTP